MAKQSLSPNIPEENSFLIQNQNKAQSSVSGLGSYACWRDHLVHRLRRSARPVTTYVLLSIFLLIAILPFYGIAITSLKTPAEISRGIFSLPEVWHFENFLKAWEQARFSSYFRTSLIVAISVVSITTILTIMSGYAFARFRFPFSQILFLIILLDMMVPQEAFIIPLYHNMRSLGLIDTYWALILPQIGMGIGFGTFWMRSAFVSVPRDLVDAAKVDGGDSWIILWRVMVPVVRPAIMAMMVLYFVWTWAAFLVPLVMVTSDDLRTLPIGLAFFQGRFVADIPLTAAGATIVALPTILFYLIFQRHFIRGISVGAVHG
jgi:raffinose/stachyose/melibiose transport system permease protein